MDPSSDSARPGDGLDPPHGRLVGAGLKPTAATSHASRVLALLRTPARAAALSAAVSQFAAAHESGAEALRRCAREARADGIKAEHLAMAVHEFWTGGRTGDPANVASQQGLTRALDIALDAYFDLPLGST